MRVLQCAFSQYSFTLNKHISRAPLFVQNVEAQNILKTHRGVTLRLTLTLTSHGTLDPAAVSGKCYKIISRPLSCMNDSVIR